MGKSQNPKKRKMYLLISLVTNLGLLFSFKYFNFFNESFRTAFNHFNIFYNVPAFNVLLPVGISFYTFQTLSYSIDVFRGKKEPEKHLGIFALYVAFFPQLVAGPIERSTHLLPQFKKNNEFDYHRVTSGLRLVLWGFFKKIVIADRLAEYVNLVYAHPADYPGMILLTGTYFFAIQVYCDFSAYSDIAIGTARILGYDLMINFRRPFFARSIAEFWTRWHISLMSWFRDYLYIPLGGNRVPKWRWYCNLIIVFMISGLWHGANWTFVVFGVLQGVFIIFSQLTENIREKIARFSGIQSLPRLHNFIKIFITFNLFAISLMVFRANSLKDAMIILRGICHIDFGYIGLNSDIGPYYLTVAAVTIIFLAIIDLYQEVNENRMEWIKKPWIFRWTSYLILMMFILIFGVFKSQEFIYFQF
jgi:D-alanyl-lipoteichoic acid acyltransferase DltB (MBOAT superfamily)